MNHLLTAKNKEMKPLNFMLCLLPLATVLSCNNATKSGSDQTETAQLLPITNNPDNPNRIFLKLVDQVEGDTVVSYVAKGLYRDDTVGLFVEVSKNIPAGINNDGSVNEAMGFKKGWITFKTLGKESDRFISALAELWQVSDIEKMTTEPVQPLAFSSNRAAVDQLKPATSSFKLFFDESSRLPGEIFFTFDTYRRSIEFQEKDEQHRFAIARSFAE